MLRLAVCLAFIAGASACDVAWPNGTDTQVNWWQCGGQIQFLNATPQDMSGEHCPFFCEQGFPGNYEYPIHLSKPLIIHTYGNNPSKTWTSPSLKQTINVWQWAKSSACSWSSVPTFGLLKNLDACTNGVNCPINPGYQYFDFELDFSDYGSIISLLTDNAPYQLQYILDDTSAGTVACLEFQARAYIH